jgi:uncharacterized repeat protein (TIGR02543 family)
VYKTVDVLKGNSVADDDIPKLTKTGYTFLGWGYNDTASPPNVIPVNSGTAITASLVLSPQWYTGTPPDVVIGDGTAGNLATTLMTKILGAAAGTSVVANGGTITQTGGIWTLRLSEISPIWFAAKTITFTFNYTSCSAAGTIGHNWKTGNLWTDNTDAAPTEGGQYPSVVNGTKAYTFNISALSKGGLSSQTSGSGGTYTFEITKVELKF